MPAEPASLVGQLELELGLLLRPRSPPLGLFEPAFGFDLDGLFAVDVKVDQLEQPHRLGHLEQSFELFDIVGLVWLLDLAQRLRLDRQLVLVGELTAALASPRMMNPGLPPCGIFVLAL